MKKNLTIILLLISSGLFAQSNIRLNNYWDNTYYINPGSVNNDYHGLFSLVARKQWIGFPGAPNTVFATGTTYLDGINTQFGIKVYADKLGYNTISDVSVSYAYSAGINYEWRLNMGLAGSYQCLSYDKSQVSVMTSDDPALYENLLQQNNYNADIGLELVNNDWRLGLSAQNILTRIYNDNKAQVNSNYLYAIYHKKTTNQIDMQYGACAILYDDLFQMEFNITSFFKFQNESDVFQAGFFYRTQSEMGIILGVNFNENWHLAYSYDFNVSGISRGSVGTHELMLSYKLDKILIHAYHYR